MHKCTQSHRRYGWKSLSISAERSRASDEVKLPAAWWPQLLRSQSLGWSARAADRTNKSACRRRRTALSRLSGPTFLRMVLMVHLHKLNRHSIQFNAVLTWSLEKKRELPTMIFFRILEAWPSSLEEGVLTPSSRRNSLDSLYQHWWVHSRSF